MLIIQFDTDVLYSSCIAERQGSANPRESLQPCVEALMQASSEPVSSEDMIMSAYYTDEILRPLVISKSGKPHLIPSFRDASTQAGLAELCDTAVEEATACFTYATGDSELFVQTEDDNDDIEDV